MIFSKLLVVLVGTLVTPASPASGYDRAAAVADACETETSWVENMGGGMWRGVCGDSEGNEVEQSCQQRAELHWAIVDGLAGNSDAAYEDTIYLCGKDGK